MNFALFIYFVGLFTVRSYAENFTHCKTSDSACLKKSIEDVIHLMKSGNSEFGFKPLDPLSIETMTVGAGQGPVQLVQHYDNIKLIGLKDSTVTKAHYDDKKKTLLFSVMVPKVIQKAHYVIDGAILTLPVVGNGESTLVLENVEFTLNFQLEETKKNGKTYFKILSLGNSIEPKHVSLDFKNLFNGNKLLGDNINKVVNEEWQALYSDVRERFEQSYAEVFKKIAQEFFDKVPVEQMFLK